ncbi:MULTISPECIES: tryptophan 2,3-dioxygenase family protein [unclassified Streptomyces]|uniref:tryptophan 2,3-dioxygenase n=1 Tax=unclassified Streptomyces TaxID=2593676 RepID=UPI001489EFD2|nr:MULTISPECIES: tryptophan 2,3-dioxygenase family protein [unclassified Streptomyces]
MTSESSRDLRPSSAISGVSQGTTKYLEYFQVQRLHSLQHPVTDTPYEMAFLVSSQVMELYFGLLCHELGRSRQAIRTDDIPGALRTLSRSASHLRALEGTWESYTDMTPTDWNPIVAHLGGSSSVQSPMYRHLNFLLGLKSPKMLAPHEPTPQIYEGLRMALGEPSLYDEALALVHRRGVPLPDSVLRRDFTEPYAARPEVEAAWTRVYADDSLGELRELAEALLRIADRFNRWKQGHLTVTQRTYGPKPGFYGTDAVAWLRRSLDLPVFPELWSARAAM